MASARFVILLFVLLAAAGVMIGHGEASNSGGTIGICIDPYGTYNPLVIPGGCYVDEVRFEDSLILRGRALLHDDFAPVGTSISAHVGSTSCGEAQMPSGNKFAMFRIEISGAGAMTGCAAADDVVELRVGGKAASELTWLPEPVGYSRSPAFGSLAAVEPYAWYWFERDGEGVPAPGDEVLATIGDTVCGTATVETDLSGPFLFISPDLVGFSRLIVPPADVEPGCGTDGTDVEFILDGYGSLGTVSWEPGLHRVDLGHSQELPLVLGDANCDNVVTSIDAALILQYDAGLLPELTCAAESDTDGSGDVTSLDAALVLQFVAGLLLELPV